MWNATLKMLTVSGLLLGAGLAQAVADADQRSVPASEHQIQTLNLYSGADSNPMYQFNRRSADYAAVMPVTQHQASVLNLRNVNSANGHARNRGQPS